MEELRVTAGETAFRNEENGYTVLQCRLNHEEITVVGIMPEIAPGEQVAFTGVWTRHSRINTMMLPTFRSSSLTATRKSCPAKYSRAFLQATHVFISTFQKRKNLFRC